MRRFFFSETQKNDDILEYDSVIGLLDIVCFDRLEDSLDDLGFWGGLDRLSIGLLACSGLNTMSEWSESMVALEIGS